MKRQQKLPVFYTSAESHKADPRAEHSWVATMFFHDHKSHQSSSVPKEDISVIYSGLKQRPRIAWRSTHGLHIVESRVVQCLKVVLASTLHLPTGKDSLGKQALNWLSLFSLSAGPHGSLGLVSSRVFKPVQGFPPPLSFSLPAGQKQHV